jgi:hypothetical protein
MEVIEMDNSSLIVFPTLEDMKKSWYLNCEEDYPYDKKIQELKKNATEHSSMYHNEFITFCKATPL